MPQSVCPVSSRLRTIRLAGLHRLFRKEGPIKARGVRAANRPQDPAERWELAYSNAGEYAYSRGVFEIFPRNPHRAEEVPREALESLSGSCGLEGLHQLFMIPWTVRSTGWGDQKVITPYSVLAIGGRAVGLWVDKPEPAVKAVIPVERIAAIEDVTILLYSRLSFLSAG